MKIHYDIALGMVSRIVHTESYSYIMTTILIVPMKIHYDNISYIIRTLLATFYEIVGRKTVIAKRKI